MRHEDETFKMQRTKREVHSLNDGLRRRWSGADSASRFCILAFALCALNHSAVSAQSYDTYLWQAHQAANIPATEVTPLVQRLREQINRILDAGHLAPMRQYFADLDNTAYYLYQEPGRIITTLAMAYPYCTDEQRTAIRAYVRAECGAAGYAPWSSNASLPENEGARREYYQMSSMWGWGHWYGMDGQGRPRLHTLYGLWLYAWNSGDSAVVRDNWTAIRNFYTANASRGALYGPLSGHIAMARLAHLAGDNTTAATAAGNATAALSAGTSLSAIRSATAAVYSYKHDPRNDGLIYHGWMFLNLSAEVGRFLADSAAAPVLALHDSARAMFPLWWVARAQYFCRWTGDEGIGLPSEAIGMLFPVERWVKQVAPAVLAGYRMDAACHAFGIGDCYTLEALVNTINACGSQSWVDVRSQAPQLAPFDGEIGVLLSRQTAPGNALLHARYSGGMLVIRRDDARAAAIVQVFTLDGRVAARGTLPPGIREITLHAPSALRAAVCRIQYGRESESTPVLVQ